MRSVNVRIHQDGRPPQHTSDSQAALEAAHRGAAQPARLILADLRAGHDLTVDGVRYEPIPPVAGVPAQVQLAALQVVT